MVSILPLLAKALPKSLQGFIVSEHYRQAGQSVKVHWPAGNYSALGGGMGLGDMGPPGEWQMRGRGNNPDSFASFSAVYTCVQIISGDISKLPVKFFDINDDGTLELNTTYPMNRVMLKPNPYQNRLQFIQLWVISTLLAGNTYIYLRRDARNMIKRMDILDPRRVILYLAQDGSIFYRVGAHPLAGIDASMTIPARDIYHHRMILSPSYPLLGVTPIYAAAASTQTGQQIMMNAQAFFGNSARPGGALTAPGPISDELATRLERDWNNSYGNSRSGKTAVLGEGLTFVPISMSYVDAQVIEQMRFSIEDVARVFRVPGFMVGDMTKTTFRNTEMTNRTYLNSCLSYHLDSIETALEEIFEIQGFMEVAFDLNAILRTEIDLRYGAYQRALQSGWMTINEVRQSEGMPPIANGDEPYIQSQNRPLSVIAEADDLNPSGAPAGAAKPDPSSPDGGSDGSEDSPPSDDGESEGQNDIDTERARKLLHNKLRARGIANA